MPPITVPSLDSYDIRKRMSRIVVGQQESVEALASLARRFSTGLAPSDRPIGSVLITGMSGGGKTKTFEAFAEALHGNPKNLLKIDCGEYQMDHEVAKLIGAPPGYLGHRDTTPLLNQGRLNNVTSDRANVSIVLFDEIEKAAPSLVRLLLGVLDKGVLRLGDNTTVNFERSIIGFTSNLGAEAFRKMVRPKTFNLDGSAQGLSDTNRQSIGKRALEGRFPPEFLNRLDHIVVAEALQFDDYKEIAVRQLVEMQRLLSSRLGPRAPILDWSEAALALLAEKCMDPMYGARPLKRFLHKSVIDPISALLGGTHNYFVGQPLIYIHAEDGELVLHDSEPEKAKVATASALDQQTQEILNELPPPAALLQSPVIELMQEPKRRRTSKAAKISPKVSKEVIDDECRL